MTRPATREQLRQIRVLLADAEQRRRQLELRTLDRFQASQLLIILEREASTAAGVRPGRVVAGAKHGTVTGYYSHGCRCGPCQTAGREYRASRESDG